MSELELRRFSIFAGLEEPELRLVAYLLERRSLGADDRLWKEGEVGGSLVVVTRGSIRFESRSEGALGAYDAPVWFGGASLVAELPREVSAYASEPTEVLSLCRTAFAQLLETAPRTAANILLVVTSELASVLRDGIAFLAPRR